MDCKEEEVNEMYKCESKKIESTDDIYKWGWIESDIFYNYDLESTETVEKDFKAGKSFSVFTTHHNHRSYVTYVVDFERMVTTFFHLLLYLHFIYKTSKREYHSSHIYIYTLYTHMTYYYILYIYKGAH